MADIAQLHRRALDETRSVVAGTDRAQSADATPCDGWDVQALLNHLVSGNLWAAELGSGHTIEEVGDRLDGDVLGNDALAAYDASARAAAATFEAPGALDRALRRVLRTRPRFGVRRSPFHRCPDSRMGPGDRHRPGRHPRSRTARRRLQAPPGSGRHGTSQWDVRRGHSRARRCGTPDATPRVHRSQRLRNTAGDFAASAATAGRRSEVGFRGLSRWPQVGRS